MLKKASYLSQLHFDPNLKNKWWAKYIVNIRLVILLMLSIIFIGVYSFISIPRRLNPEVKIPIVVVSTFLPGASPSDIESLVTIPIEDKVKNIKGLDTLTSTSHENVSVVQMQFLSKVDGDKALQDVRTALGGSLGLPTDAKDPSVLLLDFEDQPIWTFAVTTDKDTASLMRFSRQLRDKIKDLPKVDRVVFSGYDTQEIQVIIDPVKLNEYGINPGQLAQLVKQATASYPSGSLKTSGSTFALSIEKDVLDIPDLRNLRLTDFNGQSFLLSDVARVIETSKADQPKTILVHKDGLPQQAVEFFVYKAKNQNIDAAEKDAKKAVEETTLQYGNKFMVTTISNSAEEIVKQFSELFNDFGQTVILVFILLLIFLGFRQAVISSLTVPLTFLATFSIINALGLTLNFLTAFAFLIALGLLIDDTIVTVAAMTRYYRSGRFTAAETGMLVWRDFIVPLWSTTITTIWAFVPLLLAGGIIGEFIKSIPIVVTVTMLSSTTVAVLIALPLMIVILKPKIARRVRILMTVVGLLALLALVVFLIPHSVFYPLAIVAFIALLFVLYQIRANIFSKGREIMRHKRYGSYIRRLNTGFFNIEVLSDKYQSVIDRILLSRTARRNTIIAIVVFAVVGYALVGFGLVKSEFFPKSNEDILYVQVDLPSGTNISSASKEMTKFVEKVKTVPNINYLIADSAVSMSGNGGRSDEPSSFLLTLHLLPKATRHETSSQIAENVRKKLKNYTSGTVSVVELSGGPPAGADVQITFLGDDLPTIDTYANKMVDFMKKQDNLTNVLTSNKPSTSKIVFVPDKQKMADAEITPDQLGLWLRTYASGFTLDTIKVNNTDTDIVFKMGSKEPTPQALGSIVIPGKKGSVQLLSLGTLKLATNQTGITREEGKREITVTASVTNGVSATEKNKDIEKFADKLNLPEGYSWKTGGVNEENTKSVQSIIQAMALAFLLILITMVIEFGSFRQTLIALLIIPLGISGVFYVFALTNTPLSFPALIGILALFGIIVTHAIVVIEKINENRANGMDLHNSLVDAARNRLEPVLLTSLATIVGLIPITLADPLWRGLGGAIIAGLLFSGAIKLFFVPVMYYNWFNEDKKDKVKK